MLSALTIFIFLRRVLRLRFLGPALCCFPQCATFTKPEAVSLYLLAAAFLVLIDLQTLDLDFATFALILAFDLDIKVPFRRKLP